ncbi:hypothetical protein P7C71_g2502, partial [Lecanoromycetidae sp. Uapishka_2]
MLTTTRTVESLENGDIAFISCDPSDYAGNINAQRTINLAVNNKPQAIVLYSIYADSCTFNPTDDFQYLSMYTMLNASQSAAVVTGLSKNDPPYPMTTIHVDSNSINGTAGDSSNNGILGKSPTTAVAMIILYSITGIITALFLAIIIVGAIRAHRHPERYGPRRVIGRPRQSRAKGIARAMLETLPIVKFGDLEDDKPVQTGRDVELANVPHTDATEHAGQAMDEATGSNTVTTSAGGPDIVTTEAAAGTTESREGETDNGLVCSVCTEDFVKGQDVRVLPCKHKFHPECIDPWLLNVSGTCPLCRVDLHPTTSHASTDESTLDTAAATTEPTMTSPNDILTTETTARRNRRSRILHTLNVGRMRHATPEERLAALRHLRRENPDPADDVNQEQGGWMVGERTMNRFSRRFSRAFGAGNGSRPQSGVAAPISRPVSEFPEASTEVTTDAHAPEVSEPETHARGEEPVVR